MNNSLLPENDQCDEVAPNEVLSTLTTADSSNQKDGPNSEVLMHSYPQHILRVHVKRGEQDKEEL